MRSPIPEGAFFGEAGAGRAGLHDRGACTDSMFQRHQGVLIQPSETNRFPTEHRKEAISPMQHLPCGVW